MPSLETQVGQIYINNRKLSRSFVSLFSEKILETNAEIYALMEMPLLNPAAWSEYEKIFKNIFNILRRNFKKTNPNAFENSIAQINDFLAKTAGQGQTGWFGTISACLAVRQNENLYAASTGKIQTYLLREGQLSEISETYIPDSPLRTFENFAFGKIKKGDFLILSTTQLFNYVSLMRLQQILNDLPLGPACQTMAKLIQDLADETVSFAAFIIEFGFVQEFSESAMTKLLNITEDKSIFDKIKGPLDAVKRFAAHTILLTKQTRVPKINLSNISTAALKEHARAYTDLSKLKALPKAKKFFLFAALIFIVLLAINIFVAIKLHYRTKNNEQLFKRMAAVQQKISDSNFANIASNAAKAKDLLKQATAELESIPESSATKNKKMELKRALLDLQYSIEHIRVVDAQELFKPADLDTDRIILSSGTNLYAINRKNGSYARYDLTSRNFKEKDKLGIRDISSMASAGNGLALIKDKDGSVYLFDFSKKSAIKQKLKLSPDYLGFAVSATGRQFKIYTVDKNKNKILFSNIINLKNPLEYSQTAVDSKNISDIAVDSQDSAVYILNKDKIHRLYAGKPKPFKKSPETLFSDGSKIITGKNYLYVLDPVLKRVILIDKKSGNIASQLATKLSGTIQDFSVDENSKSVYLLNNNTIFIVHY